MSVSSACQGLGIGKKLLRRAILFAVSDGYEDIILGTSHYQQRARHLYERNGFHITSSFFVWHSFVPFYIYRYSYRQQLLYDCF